MTYRWEGNRRQQHFKTSTTLGLLAEYPASPEGSVELSRGFVLPGVILNAERLHLALGTWHKEKRRREKPQAFSDVWASKCTKV